MTSTHLTPRIHARLSTYATLAGVALAAPALAPNATAGIVYSGPVSINVPSTTAGIYLNVVTGVSAVAPGGAPNWDLNPWGSGSLFVYGNGAASGNGALANFAGGSSATLVDNLPFGATINGSYSFVNGGVETTGATAITLNSTANYVGFKFVNESTGGTDFGWAQFSLGATSASQPRTLVGYAYEDTGAAIAAGAVPEPTTTATLGLGVLALGAAGVRRWRKARPVVA